MTDEPLYQLTLTSDPRSIGRLTHQLLIQLHPELLQPGTVVVITSGARRFRVIEEGVPTDLSEGIFRECRQEAV